MGGGSTTPTDSVVKEGTQSFDERKSPSTSESSKTAGSMSDSDSGSTQDGTGSDIQSHPEGGFAATEWENGDGSVITHAANTDRGHDPALASRVKATDTITLESQFTDAKSKLDSGDTLSDEHRFVGGVLAARSDSGVTASDVYSFDNVAPDESFEMDSGEVLDQDAVVQQVQENVQYTFQQMDEYVAGRTMAQIRDVQINDLGVHENGNPISGTYSPMTGDLQISPKAYRNGDGYTEMTEAHEIGHAVEMTFNTRLNNQNSLQDGYEPEDLEFSVRRDKRTYFPDGASTGVEVRAESAEEFRKGVTSLGEKLKQSKTGDVTDEMRGELREYQLQNASELFAVAHGTYHTDFVLLSNQQPGMVDHIDEFVTDLSWNQATLDTIETSGVGIDHPAKSEHHFPNGDSPDEYGEVVKVNMNDEMSREIDSWTGFVGGVDSDEVTLASNGNEVNIPRDKIESVEVRDW